MISIRQPLCFSEIGKKENQEDFLFPSHADIHTRAFILCDGMGGHDNGEVASMTAATALGNYLHDRSCVTTEIFEEALSAAYDALDGIDTGSTKTPGSTMTCLCLNDDSYLVAHIGDSRIYHIRPSLFDPAKKRGGILYQSSDHSLVNDLLKAGELTEEEAKSFPQKNIITRAMQPHLQRRYRADVFMFDNIESGDYFFLCCDGILEQLDNNTLCSILANPDANDHQKLNEIKSVCDGKTRDNYTCWLIPIDKVEIKRKSQLSHVIEAAVDDSGSHDDKELSVIPFNEPTASEDKPLPTPASGKTNLMRRLSKRMPVHAPQSAVKKWLLRLLYLLVALIVILCALYCIKTFFIDSKEKGNATELPKETPEEKKPDIHIPAPSTGEATVSSSEADTLSHKGDTINTTYPLSSIDNMKPEPPRDANTHR